MERLVSKVKDRRGRKVGRREGRKEGRKEGRYGSERIEEEYYRKNCM